MEFDIYCDETLPDLFTSRRPHARYLMIGGLWILTKRRQEAKDKITALRQRHPVWGEMKWTKISPAKQAFYEDLIDLFISFDLDMRFRCIAVDHQHVDFGRHENDKELGFYKFYYQLLHHWIEDTHQYHIFCDLKTNRDPKRLHQLKYYLCANNPLATITDIQSLPSPEVVLIQLCDVFLGIVSNRINEVPSTSQAKKAVVQRFIQRLNLKDIEPTQKTEKKFNLFKIRLDNKTDNEHDNDRATIS